VDIGYALFKAVVQGLTEFLPVSSSAHLVFTDALMGMFGWQQSHTSIAEEEFYDILLHMGTLAAVLWYFRWDLTAIIQGMLSKPVDNRSVKLDGFDLKKLPWQIALTTTITVIFILAMLKGSKVVFAQLGWATAEVADISDYYRTHPYWVAIHLTVTGALLFFTETYSAKRTAPQQPFGFKNAALIGLFQGFAAIFRGISRSGSTISAGLMSGADRVTATRYAFLISIPVFILAEGYELVKMLAMGLSDSLDWPMMAVGLVVTALVGYACIKYFIQFVARHSLKPFAYYCWTVAVIMLTLFSPLLAIH